MVATAWRISGFYERRWISPSFLPGDGLVALIRVQAVGFAKINTRARMDDENIVTSMAIGAVFIDV